MKFCLLNILMEIILLRKGQAILVKELVHKSGKEASFPCEAVGNQTYLFWLPLNPKCANTSTERVEINWNPARNEVIPLRFNQRLIYQPPQLLILKNLIMSDSGIYICHLSNGSETHTKLQVTTEFVSKFWNTLSLEEWRITRAFQGCHNNILVSSYWLTGPYLQLTCQLCKSRNMAGFHWLVNSKRLGNPRWAKKSDMGSSLLLYPIRDIIWGRWECQSTFNPTWSSELCLSSPAGEMDKNIEERKPVLQTLPSLSISLSGFDTVPEDMDSTQPTWSSPAIIQTTEVTQGHHAVHRIDIWIWMLLLAGLALITAALTVTLYFWKKDFSGRYPHDNTARATGERMEHTGFASARNPIRKEKKGKQESLDERSASLYYAQLQHLHGKSPPVQTPDNATVYAVIV